MGHATAGCRNRVEVVTRQLAYSARNLHGRGRPWLASVAQPWRAISTVEMANCGSQEEKAGSTNEGGVCLGNEGAIFPKWELCLGLPQRHRDTETSARRYGPMHDVLLFFSKTDG